MQDQVGTVLYAGGGEGTLYNGLYGEAPPERGTFFSLKVYKRVGIARVEVKKRAGKTVIWVFSSDKLTKSRSEGMGHNFLLKVYKRGTLSFKNGR